MIDRRHGRSDQPAAADRGSCSRTALLRRGLVGLFLACSLLASIPGCQVKTRSIKNTGSDTLVNLAQVWAEEYQGVDPTVSVELSGGGSGVGINDLIAGSVDIANCSREITKGERAQAERNTGKTPIEWIVAYDGIAVYVHKDNPLEELSAEDLAGIYGEGGSIERWSQLGIDHSRLCGSDEIVRVSRQSNSGTYAYFREKILGKGDFKAGSLDMDGSEDVVRLIGKSPCAIGYSGMGYKSADVKYVRISAKRGGPAFEPSIENVRNRTYPFARSLLMYTLGEPQGYMREYLEWILSAHGQAIVGRMGYVPVEAAKGGEGR